MTLRLSCVVGSGGFSSLSEMNTPCGVIPCLRRVTPVNVVYASFASEVATSFYPFKKHRDKPEYRREAAPVAYSFSQIIFLFRVPQLVLRWTVQDTNRLGITENKVSFLLGKSRRNRTHDAEYCVPLATILDGFVDDPMLDGNLISACFFEVRHSGIVVAEVYLRETLIE